MTSLKFDGIGQAKTALTKNRHLREDTTVSGRLGIAKAEESVLCVPVGGDKAKVLRWLLLAPHLREASVRI